MDKEIESLIKKIGLPYAYRLFKKVKNKEPPAPPFVVYFCDEENSWGADCVNLIKRIRVVIELYTDAKNMEIEQKIESVLSGYELEKIEEYITEENLNMVSYEFDIYEKIRRETL